MKKVHNFSLSIDLESLKDNRGAVIDAIDTQDSDGYGNLHVDVLNMSNPETNNNILNLLDVIILKGS